jgi:hypothetical protein
VYITCPEGAAYIGYGVQAAYKRNPRSGFQRKTLGAPDGIPQPPALGVDEWSSWIHQRGGADEPMRMMPSENRRQKDILPHFCAAGSLVGVQREMSIKRTIPRSYLPLVAEKEELLDVVMDASFGPPQAFNLVAL